MAKSSDKKSKSRPKPILNTSPIPQIRLDRGDVHISSKTIQSDDGSIGRPYLTRNTITRMKDAGTITKQQLQAGEQFHAIFVQAGMVSLRASNLAPSSHGTPGLGTPFHSTAARENLRDQINTLGGLTSPAGCCAWFVLGEELTLREWSIREGWRGRPITLPTASKILIGALETLAEKYLLTSAKS